MTMNVLTTMLVLMEVMSILPSTMMIFIMLPAMVAGLTTEKGPPISIVRTLVDDSDCGGCNTGQCIEPSIAFSINFDTSTTLGGLPSCDCKGIGFTGEHCEIPCSKHCQNGGKCLPGESESSMEVCSCSKAIVDGKPFAGLECEFGATKSCMALGSESKHSFCTNDGLCQDIVEDNEQHKDCHCPEGYEGPHCEYLLGTELDPSPKIAFGASAAEQSESYQSPWQVTSTSDMIVYAMIAVIAALILVLLLAFGLRNRKRKMDAKMQEKKARVTGSFV